MRTITWLAIPFALYMGISQYVGKGVSEAMVELSSQDFVDKFMLVMYWVVVTGIFVILGILLVQSARGIWWWFQRFRRRGIRTAIEQQDSQTLEIHRRAKYNIQVHIEDGDLLEFLSKIDQLADEVNVSVLTKQVRSQTKTKANGKARR